MIKYKYVMSKNKMKIALNVHTILKTMYNLTDKKYYTFNLNWKLGVKLKRKLKKLLVILYIYVNNCKIL